MSPAELNPWAIAAATVAAFVFSGAWYALLGARLQRLSAVYAESARSTGTTAAIELARGLVVTTGVAVLVAWTGAEGAGGLLGLAALLALCFPAVLLAGSVWHERVPPGLALIHAGDWAIKLLLVTIVVGLWR